MRELIAIRGLLHEIQKYTFEKEHIEPTVPTHSTVFLPPSKVFEDNSACLKHATMPKLSPRTKHIGIPYHFFRSEVIKGNISVLPIATDDQLADQFTKGLPHSKFEHLRKRLLGW